MYEPIFLCNNEAVLFTMRDDLASEGGGSREGKTRRAGAIFDDDKGESGSHLR